MEKIFINDKVAKLLRGMHAYVDITPNDFILTIPMKDIKVANVLKKVLIEACFSIEDGDC